VETPRKFITAKLSIRKPGSSSVLIIIVLIIHIISTDEDTGLRIESFAVINLRGVSTNKTIYFIAMQTYKELIKNIFSYDFFILISIIFLRKYDFLVLRNTFLKQEIKFLT
jgi:hypothetical protein